MYKNKIDYIIGILILQFCSSCSAYKELPYLKNNDDELSEKTVYAAEINEPLIMPDDIINITVNSTFSGTSNGFNLPAVSNNLFETDQSTTIALTASSGTYQNYAVDKRGYIDFPILGEIHIGGLTINEAKQKLLSIIYPQYIEDKPIINIRFTNYKISVLGEVNRPGIYSTGNGQITILDALAAAGDITIYGRRDNVLLVRVNKNDSVEMHRINLQNVNLVSDKEIFFLQQNDKLYIETNKAKGNNSRFGAFETISISVLSIIISVAAILIR